MNEGRSMDFLLSQNAIPSKKPIEPVTNCDRFSNLEKKWFAFSKMDVSAIEMLQRVKI